MAKKGILIRNGSQEVHKLDDEGGFKLGMREASDTTKGTIEFRAGTLTISEPDDGSTEKSVASVHGSIESTATKITGEAGAAGTDTLERAAIDTKLTALEGKLGTDASGAATWAAGDAGLNAATTFSGADVLLDTAVAACQTRMDQIMGNTHANSMKNKIAQVVFGSGDGTQFPGTTFDTVKGIQDALTTNDAGILVGDLKANVANAVDVYITQRTAAFRVGVSASNDTLTKLEDSIDTEIARYNTKDGQLSGEFGTTMTNAGLNADGTLTAAAAVYLTTGDTTMKARDIKLDSAIKARDERMDGFFGSSDDGVAGTMNLGSLAVSGDASLNTVAFGVDLGRFTLPRMTAGQAATLGLDNAASLANGDHDGKFVFITTGNSAAGSVFPQTNKLYMCEDGTWSASLFISE